MAVRALRYTIERLAEWFPQLFVDPYVVACVAAMSRYSSSPGVFDVECEGLDTRRLAGTGRFGMQVLWTEATAEKAERIRSTMPANEIVELASVALAFALARRVLGLRELIVTSRGEAAVTVHPRLRAFWRSVAQKPWRKWDAASVRKSRKRCGTHSDGART